MDPALALLMLAAALVVVHAETCRGWLLRREDARTMAAFRIATGVCTIAWTLELWPLLDYLFTDDGMFLTDAARQEFASAGFAGIADGSAANEPAGPLDPLSVVHLLASPRHSLLYFWDDPQTVRLHTLALLLAATCFTVGLGTTVTKWITFALFHSLLSRNHVLWGGEQVYGNFFLLLCLSRCGHAYSLDALLRVPRGRPALDRMIPAWPRALALLQLIPVFTANGFAKTGAMWAAGDTFHYMFMHSDFHRVDPTALAAMFSTNLFRVMTWVTHGFELLFPLALAGMVLRFHRDAGIAALRGPRRSIARLLWIGTAIALASLALAKLEGRERETLCFAVPTAGAATIVVLAIAGPWLRPLRVGRVRIDRDWVCRWPLGRRVWVTLLVLFTGNLVLLTTLGWFTVLTMTTAILFFDGAEIGAAIARLRRRPIAPPAPPSPTPDVAGLPDTALAAALVALVVAGWFTIETEAAMFWGASLVAVGTALALVARRRSDGAAEHRRRFMVGWFCAFHVTAVALVVLPSSDSSKEGRTVIAAPFRRWLDLAQSNQFWGMFAPNGPHAVHSLEVEVTTTAGDIVAIGSGIPAPTGSLQFGRDKREKIARKIAGGEYMTWHGRYICRRWATEHDVPAEEVTLWRSSYPIAPPEAYAYPILVAEIEGQIDRKILWQKRCAHEAQAQPTTSAEFVPWTKRRRKRWAEMRASGDAPDLPWALPIFGVPWLVLVGRRPWLRPPGPTP